MSKRYSVTIRDRGIVVGVYQVDAENALLACYQAEAQAGAKVQQLTMKDKDGGKVAVQWSGLESEAKQITDEFGYDLTMA